VRSVLVTVVGPAGQRDLSLPADPPAAELLPSLVRLLGGAHKPQPGSPPPDSTDPPAWALLTTTGQPIPSWTSLAEHGVLHGAHLYLVAHPPLPPQLRHLRP
jgi:WXG100 protein secretion system (Wss), protein YukD